MSEIRDERGRSARYAIAFEELGRLQEEVALDQTFAEWAESQPDRISSFALKGISRWDLSDPQLHWRGLYFMRVCAWTIKARGIASALVILKDRPWGALLIKFGRSLGLDVRLSPRPARASLAHALPPRVASFLRQMRYGGAAGAIAWCRAQMTSVRSIGRLSRVAAHYYGHLNVDSPEMQSDLFFAQQSSLLPERVLVLFEIFRDPLTVDRLKALRARGLDGLAVHPKAAASPSVPTFIQTSFPCHPKAGRGALESAERRWLEDQRQRYWQSRDFWRDVFQKNGVRAYLTWYKSDGTHCAIADALKELGGVLALYQRSFEPHPSAELMADTDIHFSFSPDSARVFHAEHSLVRYCVATGYIGDHRFKLLAPAARRLRESLSSRGAKRIFALFDENSIEESRWHLGHDIQRKIYDFALERVLAEPDVGLIIKPKAPSTLRSRLGPLAERLRAAEATGRCTMVEGGLLHSSHPPAVAAMASDFAVHAHPWSGTAALEAALAGTPTVVLDLEGWPTTPFRALGEGRGFFRDWQSLWAAGSDFWRHSGAGGFGDWREVVSTFDPFRDGRAAERVGDFLRSILEAIDDGCDRTAAMDRAAEIYSETWGADKIIVNKRFEGLKNKTTVTPRSP